MAAGRRDFERPLGHFLALHLGQVRPARHRLGARGFGRAQQLRAFQVRQQRQQVGDLGAVGPGGGEQVVDRFEFSDAQRRNVEQLLQAWERTLEKR